MYKLHIKIYLNLTLNNLESLGHGIRNYHKFLEF